MKVLVTGASGFIGQSLVRRLLSEGHSVRGLYRRQNLGAGLEALRQAYPEHLELLRGDLSFPASMPEAAQIASLFKAARKGIPSSSTAWPVAEADSATAEALLADVDACIHIAARVGDWGSDRDFFGGNVNPLHVLLSAAETRRLQRFVYVSSAAVHGFGHNRDSTEAGPYFAVSNPYQLSKRCAESLVNAARGRGLDTCTIRPGNVYGPGDTTTFYPIFDALHQGLMGTLASGRYLTCPVYIDDLVAALVAALGPILGSLRTFNITSGERINWRELIDQSCDALAIRRTGVDMPGFLARTAAFVLEGSFKLVGAKTAPPLTSYRVEQLLHDYHFSIAAAAASLGYQPQTGVAAGLPLTAQAYRDERLASKEVRHGG